MHTSLKFTFLLDGCLILKEKKNNYLLLNSENIIMINLIKVYNFNFFFFLTELVLLFT